MKTKMRRLKSCRPSPGHLEINRWIREQEARLGIGEVPSVGGNLPTVTVYPGPVVIERLAHYGADLLIANNAGYDSMCGRLDAELAEILEEGIPASVKNLKLRRSTARATCTHERLVI